MDLSKFSLGDKLAIIGGILLLIVLFFLPAYGFSYGGGSTFGVNIPGASYNWTLWDAGGGIGFLILLGIVGGIAVILLRAFEVYDISDLGVAEGLVVLIAAGVAGIFTLYRVAIVPGAAFGVGPGRSWGLWVGLIAAVLYVVGAFMKFQEERA